MDNILDEICKLPKEKKRGKEKKKPKKEKKKRERSLSPKKVVELDIESFLSGLVDGNNKEKKG